MPQNRLDWGNWNAICDICGFKFKASELRKNWKNEMVCEQDWEPRHPQDFLRVRGDNPAVPWTRPEADESFTFVCWIWGASAYANLAEAGCAMAGYAPLTYLLIYEMKYPPPPAPQILQNTSSIPGYAIPGQAIPGNTFTGLTYGP